VVDYFQKSIDVFPTVDIKGGVAITYRDANEIFGSIGFFSEFKELRDILKKVTSHSNFVTGEFAKLVSNRGMYRFSDLFFIENPSAQKALDTGTGNMITSNSFNLYPTIFIEDKPNNSDDYIQLFGRLGSQRMHRWIKASYVQSNEYLNTYNVFVPEANGTGAIGEVLSTPVIGVPVIGHTDTFLSIGKFANAEEASACLKYVKTKFARCMLGTLKATQHNPRSTWMNVPMQNFTESSDINWSKEVCDIDKQLYTKYSLTDKEVQFIESMIKPM
jgi:type II restriction enzyme